MLSVWLFLPKLLPPVPINYQSIGKLSQIDRPPHRSVTSASRKLRGVADFILSAVDRCPRLPHSLLQYYYGDLVSHYW